MILDELRSLCTRVRGTDGILDEVDTEFYIRFDCAIDTDNPELSAKTCDVHIIPLGADDWKAASIRVIANASRPTVLRFLFALGVSRFPQKIREAMYQQEIIRS